MKVERRDFTKENIERGKEVLPTFPSTPHWTPSFLDEKVWFIEEKSDGANMGMALDNGEIYLRNREHILRKGYNKDTPSKQQFVPAWNFVYEHKKALEKLNKSVGGVAAVYGEWCYALHGVEYDSLKEYFIAFDIYVSEEKCFLPVEKTRQLLQDVGFVIPPLLWFAPIDLNTLNTLANGCSQFSTTELKEGLYLKNPDSKPIPDFSFSDYDRKKFIRPGYVQGKGWSDKQLTKQQLKKS